MLAFICARSRMMDSDRSDALRVARMTPVSGAAASSTHTSGGRSVVHDPIADRRYSAGVSVGSSCPMGVALLGGRGLSPGSLPQAQSGSDESRLALAARRPTPNDGGRRYREIGDGWLRRGCGSELPAPHAADHTRTYDKLAGRGGWVPASIGRVFEQPGSPERQAFAENVRDAREKAGMTQEQLAWAAGLHQTEIARIEGGRRNPGLDTIFKVARGLGVPPASLFSGIA